MFDISFGLLSFDRIPVECVSKAGDHYTRWFSTGMPRIPDEALSCCFFCYANEDDAAKGVNPSGTGFLVAHRDTPTTPPSIYAVTNHHVAVSGGKSVIRINLVNGKTKVFEFDSSEWEFASGGADVAAIELDPSELDGGFAYVSTSIFVNEAQMTKPEWRKVFVGDDVFMVGMYFDH